MKCELCKTRMSDGLINFDYQYNGKTKKAVNVPAFKCPVCYNMVIPDSILRKLNAFAALDSSNTVDYAKCEQEEAAVIAALDLFSFGG